VEAPYSLRSFLEHNVAGALLFLCLLFLLLAMVFVIYRRKTQQNQRELESAYVAANKAAQAKTVFLSTMSHDIRTPMNAIVNLTALAREELDDREKLEADLGKIDVSNKFLLGLINDILDISKIESGELILNNTVYPYERFRDYIRSVVGPLCDSKNIRFVFVESRYPVGICTDEVRFNQIFFNLLSNAVKYSEPGSTVTLRTENERLDGQTLSVDFIVEDNGVGMSEDFQAKMLTPFERENSGDARMGTGLGLAITKHIVDAMGGTITVESERGRGTKIRVHLEPALATPAQLQSAGKKLPAESAAAAEPDLRGRRVLFAEDNAMNREIVTRILETEGLAVDVAEDGAQALAAFEKSAVGYYDVILMDIRMPVMNALDSARAIRALHRAASAVVPIIATTAEAFEQEREEVFSAGMNGNLAKPIDPRQLRQAIAEAIAGKAPGTD